MTKPRFASLTAGLLARKGEAAPPAALFNKQVAPPESPAQFDDVSPEMQSRIDSIVESVHAPSNWTQPPADPEPEALDLEVAYGMDDQRSAEPDADSDVAHGLVSAGLRSMPKDRQSDGMLFKRMVPKSTPQFGRRNENTNPVIVSMRPKKNQQRESGQGEDKQAETEGSEKDRTLIVSRARAPSARRTAITLRLDEARYLRLKYAGAQLDKTSQAILETALDRYLESLGDKFTHDTEWLRRSVSIIRRKQTG